MSKAALSAMLHHPIDVVARGACALANPFFADVRAAFTGPGGRRLVIPGFYNGDGSWVVRFSPTAVGSWRYVCESAHVDLARNEGEIECLPNANPSVHGGLTVDRDSPHHFRYEDGTPYFFMAYEADWIWAPGLGDPEIRKVKELVDQIRAHGFNQVFLNVYAHDTRWCRGTTSEFDYGPPPVYAWEGTNEDPDHSRMNPAFFENLDRVVGHLFENGIIAHLYFRVYNKMVSWPRNGSPEDDLYFSYVTARYQAFPNVVWDFSKETFNEPDKAYVADRIRLVRSRDAYGRLFTVHDDPDFCHDPRYESLVDFFTDQHQQADWCCCALFERGRRAIPYVNAEFGYERNEPQIITHAVESQRAEELLHRAYEVVMGGGYVTYYYNLTAWDVVDSRKIPDGYRCFKILHDFFTSLEWWRLSPMLFHGWRSGVRCLARRGEEYVFYLPKGERRRACVIGASGVFTERWLNTLTGEIKETPDRTIAEPTSSTAPLKLNSPFGEAACLLHLRLRS